MNDIRTFFLGILSGVIVSLIVNFLLNTFSSLRRFIPPKLRKSFDKEFKTQKHAEKNIIKDAKKSSFMYVFAMKAGSFCDIAGESQLVEIFKNVQMEQKYLISAKSDKNPYVGIRSKELHDGVALDYGIATSIINLKRASVDPNRKIKYCLHAEIVRFRLIIFDECLYISYQIKNIRGRESPVQRFCRESSGYSAMSAFFNDKWEEYSKKAIGD